MADWPTRAHRPRLMPPTMAGRIIERPRLIARLAVGRAAAVTVLVAPAGSGKTSLISTWLASAPQPVAWVTLDDADDDPSSLVETVLAAAALADAVVGGRSRPLLHATPPVPPAELGAALARDLAAGPEGLVLVLDDVQVLREPEALAVVRGVIDAQPAGVHLVLASRADVRTLVDRTQIGARLVELRAPDLSLDPDEARAVAARRDPAPEPALIEAAFVASGGWLAAFRLMLHRGAPDARPAVEQSLDWLVDSTCATLPPALVERLVHGSVVTELCDALLDAMAPDGAADAAVSLDAVGETLTDLLGATFGASGWYRLHPLVREALERRLIARHGIAAWRRAHEAASAWFHRAGASEHAVQHAMAVGNLPLVGDLLEEAGFAALNAERWDLLARLVEVAPEAVAAERPGILVLRCWRTYHRPTAAANDDRERAAQAVAAWHDADERRRWQAHLDVLATFHLAPMPPAAELIVRTDRILADLAASDALVRGILVGATGLLIGLLSGLEAGRGYLCGVVAASRPDHPAVRANALAALVMLDEQFDVAVSDRERTLEDLLELARSANLPGSWAFATIGLGWLMLERLELARARELFDEASGIVPTPSINTWRRMRGGQALAATLAGDPVADAIVADMIHVVDLVGTLDMAAHTRSFQARLDLITGRYEAVREWVARTPPPEEGAGCYALHESAALTWARAQVLDLATPPGALEGVAELVERARAQASAAPAWYRETVAIVDAQALWRGGRQEEAVRAVLPVVQQAAGRQAIASLVACGESIRPLIQACVPHGLPGGVAHEVIAGIDRLAAIWPDPMLLSPREREVLALMALPLTFDEIGARLFLAPVTVRWHAHNIYRRLGVAKRRLAVERGRALGLVAD